MDTIDLIALDTVTGGFDAPKATTITPILSPCLGTQATPFSKLSKNQKAEVLAFDCRPDSLPSLKEINDASHRVFLAPPGQPQ